MHALKCCEEMKKIGILPNPMRPLLALVVLCTIYVRITSTSPAAQEWLEEHREKHKEKLLKFLRIPSISSDLTKKDAISDAAMFLYNYLAENGLKDVRLLEVDRSPPAVFASRQGDPNLPTLLIYGHYDVQPSAPDDMWTTPAFSPVVRGGRIYARGASDDKGPVLSAAAAACAYTATTGEGSGIGIKLLIEGEEEIGSPHLDALLRTHRNLLKADFAFSADGSMFDRVTPSLCLGLRGSIMLEISMVGARDDAHSGIYGGGVRNPLAALSQLLAGLWDEDGRVNAPSFYDGVDDPTPAEIAMTRSFATRIEEDLATIGAQAEFGERGFSFYERTWLRPALDVVGMWGGYIGTGVKSVLPARAYARLSARLVGRQDPDAAISSLREVLLARSASLTGVSVNVTALSWRARPFSLTSDTPGNHAAKVLLTEAYGREPVELRLGGSIPFFYLAKSILGVDTTMLGIAYADENMHAPNEHWDLASADLMQKIYVRLFKMFEEHTGEMKAEL